jgi:hypothetical protein
MEVWLSTRHASNLTTRALWGLTLSSIKTGLVYQEWQRLAQVQIRRLMGSMRRRLAAVIRVNGNYTHY